jgi:3alpha(or 20beta)-hydroxysteroid dehydrogenase
MTITVSKLERRVALVTGGARGMGEAHARALAAEGACVVIGDVLEDEGATLAAELGDDARFVALDVTDEQSWQAAVAFAEDAFGPISVLVNNGASDETTQAARYPIPRFGTSEEVAATMLHIVCDATYSTGSEFCVDGGILAGISLGD